MASEKEEDRTAAGSADNDPAWKRLDARLGPFDPSLMQTDYWLLPDASRAVRMTIDQIAKLESKGVRFSRPAGSLVRVNIRDLVRHIESAVDPLAQKLHEDRFGSEAPICPTCRIGEKQKAPPRRGR